MVAGFFLSLSLELSLTISPVIRRMQNEHQRRRQWGTLLLTSSSTGHCWRMATGVSGVVIVAVFLSPNRSTKLLIHIPYKIEMVWAL